MVEPFDVRQCGQLDLVGVAPGAFTFDQLGLVEGVHGLSEGVVVAVADRSDRWARAELGEAVGVADAGVLAAGIGVRDDTVEQAGARDQTAISNAEAVKNFV